MTVLNFAILHFDIYKFHGHQILGTREEVLEWKYYHLTDIKLQDITIQSLRESIRYDYCLEIP